MGVVLGDVGMGFGDEEVGLGRAVEVDCGVYGLVVEVVVPELEVVGGVGSLVDVVFTWVFEDFGTVAASY